MLFSKKCASHECDGKKNVTKPGQIVASLIQGKDKMDIIPFTA